MNTSIRGGRMKLGWVIALLMIFQCAGCAVHRATTPATPLQRDALINRGWTFIRQDVADAQTPGFDDSGWQRVDLPHTWNALDGQDGGSNYYRGPGWYRQHVTISAAQMGKEIFLRFEAASIVARVYVNGQRVGEHRGAFGAFCFDVTGLIHPGDNVVAVCVDNSLFPDIAPLSGDFTMFGGLYRGVHLLTLDPAHISPLDDASPGVYLKPMHVDEGSAKIQITAKLRNDSPGAESLVVRGTVTDADGGVVATSQVDQAIGGRSGADAQMTVEVLHPHLWNGRNDPYQYQATVELVRGGEVIDRVTQPLGLRYFHVDPNRGFFLNGKSLPLHGVGVHQDYLDKGWAIGPAEFDEDYRLIDELNCSEVRLAHYQHCEYEYSLCDRHGIVVWAEVPLVNRIWDSKAFADNAKQQLRELIKQNYNHPSIFFWCIFNELGPHTRTNWRLVEQLNDLAHQLDPDRLTTAATHVEPEIPMVWIPDTIAFNRYWGWYTGTIKDWPSGLDKLRAGHIERGIGISEYGPGASIAQHEEHPTTQASTKGRWHPEEWQALDHEAAYHAMIQRPWLWITSIWVMFDFACDERKEGDQIGWNDKGLVTADRKTRKDAFYFYKANWSKEPFVYITSRRFNPRGVGKTEIKVYSNCRRVELLFNGKSLGIQSSSDHIFIWPDVDLTAGSCSAEAIGEMNGKEYRDSCAWQVWDSAGH